MNTDVIVTCAVTGGGDTVGKHPAIPVTAEQISGAVAEAASAGATICHVHARDPATGKNSRDPAHFREIVARIREQNVDVVLNLTGGNGGEWVPSDEDPNVGGPGSDMCTPEERQNYIGELLPEIASLDCGTMNFGEECYVTPTNYLREMASNLQKWKIKPEMEVFDMGQVRFASQLVAEGLIDDPPLYQLCLGIAWGAPADADTMRAMRDLLPPGAVWAGFGISRMQMPMAASAVLLGGHVRVGLEDNLYLSRGVFASNGQLVEKAVRIIEDLGARVMKPQEAREKLNLTKHH